jgi:hypothetical protein
VGCAVSRNCYLDCMVHACSEHDARLCRLGRSTLAYRMVVDSLAYRLGADLRSYSLAQSARNTMGSVNKIIAKSLESADDRFPPNLGRLAHDRGGRQLPTQLRTFGRRAKPQL